MYLTNDSALAAAACSAGVSRIFVDWERLGKSERQANFDTVKSDHSFADAVAIRAAIPNNELLIRINPINENTEAEVTMAINAGADLIMLPMFRSSNEVRRLSDLVQGRAKIVPLFETVSSLDEAMKVCEIADVYELYVGLNDLHLELQSKFMFEPLADGLIDCVADAAIKNGIRFGFGGIARVGEGAVPGEMVLGEHIRLGSKIVILSRTFYRNTLSPNAKEVFASEVLALKHAWRQLSCLGKDKAGANHALFVDSVKCIANEAKNIGDE